MTERTGIEFSERVGLRFTAAGIDTRSDAIVEDLVEFLNLKKAIGVLPHWVKHAVVEQFLRERHGGELVAATLPPSNSAKPSSVAPAEPVNSVRPEPSSADGAGVDTTVKVPEPVAPKTRPMPQGLLNMMG